jgi:hypothetical protein
MAGSARRKYISNHAKALGGYEGARDLAFNNLRDNLQAYQNEIRTYFGVDLSTSTATMTACCGSEV